MVTRSQPFTTSPRAKPRRRSKRATRPRLLMRSNGIKLPEAAHVTPPHEVRVYPNNTETLRKATHG